MKVMQPEPAVVVISTPPADEDERDPVARIEDEEAEEDEDDRDGLGVRPGG